MLRWGTRAAATAALVAQAAAAQLAPPRTALARAEQAVRYVVLPCRLRVDKHLEVPVTG